MYQHYVINLKKLIVGVIIMKNQTLDTIVKWGKVGLGTGLLATAVTVGCGDNNNNGGDKDDTCKIEEGYEILPGMNKPDGAAFCADDLFPVIDGKVVEGIAVTNRTGELEDFDVIVGKVAQAFIDLKDWDCEAEIQIIKNNVKEIRIVPGAGKTGHILENGKYIITIYEDINVGTLSNDLYNFATEIAQLAKVKPMNVAEILALTL
jgi:hypothetical protein